MRTTIDTFGTRLIDWGSGSGEEGGFRLGCVAGEMELEDREEVLAGGERVISVSSSDSGR